MTRMCGVGRLGILGLWLLAGAFTSALLFLVFVLYRLPLPGYTMRDAAELISSARPFWTAVAVAVSTAPFLLAIGRAAITWDTEGIAYESLLKHSSVRWAEAERITVRQSSSGWPLLDIRSTNDRVLVDWSSLDGGSAELDDLLARIEPALFEQERRIGREGLSTWSGRSGCVLLLVGLPLLVMGANGLAHAFLQSLQGHRGLSTGSLIAHGVLALAGLALLWLTVRARRRVWITSDGIRAQGTNQPIIKWADVTGIEFLSVSETAHFITDLCRVRSGSTALEFTGRSSAYLPLLRYIIRRPDLTGRVTQMPIDGEETWRQTIRRTIEAVQALAPTDGPSRREHAV